MIAVFSAPVLAAYAEGQLAFGSTTPLSIATSKGVSMDISLGATSGQVNNYIIGTFHSAGSRTFGSSNSDTKIYYYNVTGQAIPSADNLNPTAVNLGATSGWTPL